MQELEVWILSLHAIEKSAHTKTQRRRAGIFNIHVDVVKQHHRTIGQLWQPGVKIVADRFKSVGAVEMQKINRKIRKIIRIILAGILINPQSIS